MRIYLDQIGCRLNYSEIETLAGSLRAAGHRTVSSPEQAQVIVFNSCAVTAQAGRRSKRRIRHYHKLNPTARIAVTGCWATLQPQQAAAMPGVALVSDNKDKDLLHTLLEPWSAELDDPALLTHMQPDASPFETLDESLSGGNAQRHGRTRAFVKVQDGCNNRCTFCIVTVARGTSRSHALESVVGEVKRLAAEGVQEAVLTGVHLGSYGRDLEPSERTDLKQLVRALLTHTDIPRLRLSSLEPWELADGFFELWREWPHRLCPHLHVPLQAGTDEQLRRMARRCTVESFRDLISEARSAIPGLIVTTDLIVGFPGESEANFEKGYAFVEEMRFAHAHIFPFSTRAGTAAATFGEQIGSQIKKERSRRLHELVARTGQNERSHFLGTERAVLWEGRGDPLSYEPANLWRGRTDNYLRVMVSAPTDVNLQNLTTPVHLESLRGDTFVGQLMGVDKIQPSCLHANGTES